MRENEKLVATCQPDYEREYHRIIKENAQLMTENDVLRKNIVEMCKNLFMKGGEG